MKPNIWHTRRTNVERPELLSSMISMIIISVENNAADDHAENSGDDLADGRRGHWEAFIPLASCSCWHCVGCQPTGVDQSQTTGDEMQKRGTFFWILNLLAEIPFWIFFTHMTVIFWRKNELFPTFLVQILFQNSRVSKYLLFETHQISSILATLNFTQECSSNGINWLNIAQERMADGNGVYFGNWQKSVWWIS